MDGEVPGDGYLLDNAHRAAGERLDALAAVFDPPTFAHLERLGVGPGWRCWEVGAGGPGVASWLAGRVGPDGRVLATDIDTTWLAPAAGGPVEVLRHDVAVDPAPQGPFDLVHARLVLVHLPARQAVLDLLVGVLRPGGWLLVEDADPALQPLACLDPATPEEELANRIRTGFRSLLAGRGADLAFGRTLPRALRRAGLVDVGSDAWFPLVHPGCAAIERQTIALVGDRLRAAGIVTAEELAAHLEAVDGGRLDLTQPPMVAAWGRRVP